MSPFDGRRKSRAEIAIELGTGINNPDPSALLDFIDAALGGQTVLSVPLNIAGTPIVIPGVGTGVNPCNVFNCVAPQIALPDEVEDPTLGFILLKAPGLYAAPHITWRHACPFSFGVRFLTRSCWRWQARESCRVMKC